MTTIEHPTTTRPWQEWRPFRAHGCIEPVCPECTRLGFLLCARCLRWYCDDHRPGWHDCALRMLEHTHQNEEALAKT